MTAADGEEKSRFRWLDAARYAVTVLILAVIVNAIKVVLRLDSLQISVDKGSITTTSPFSPAPEEVVVPAMGLQLRAQNPSGRVRMYFLDISAYIFDNKTSASASLDPLGDSIVCFKPQDIAVLQQETVDSIVSFEPTKKKNMDPSYFDMLYNNNNGSRFSDMTLRLDGSLVTEVTSEINKTRLTTYYCEQLFLGGNANDEDSKSRQDVICKQRTTT